MLNGHGEFLCSLLPMPSNDPPSNSSFGAGAYE
jgi:hypothetical protein